MQLKRPKFEDIITSKFDHIADISYQRIRQEKADFFLFFHSKLCSTDKMERYLIGRLEQFLREEVYNLQETHLTGVTKVGLSDFDTIEMQLFNGFLMVYSPKIHQLFALNLNDVPTRSPEVASTEITISGARDSLIESIHVNSAIIRQRIKSSHLKYETFIVGEYTHTLVGILYIDDLSDKEIIQTTKKRIQSISFEGLTSIGQLQSALTNKPYALVPTMSYTSRTDFIAQSLLTGRFVVLVDGIPLGLIAPVTYGFFTNYSDSSNELFFVGLFDRVIQYLSLIISLFLLGFSTSLLAFNPEFIPLVLLANVFNTRKGIGMSVSFELVLADIFFQLFRIAGMRSLYGLNNALLIIGSIIIGQIAVSAGIISQTVLFISAISVISSYLISNNMSLNSSVIIMRTFIFYSSLFLGFLGFSFSSLAVITYLLNVESFGIPLMAPLSPFRLSSLITLFRPKSAQNKKELIREYFAHYKGDIRG